MTAPSKNWSNVSDSQIDADSPIDATLMAQIRDNLVHLKEWLGNSYAPAQDHDHDGVNSAGVLLADASVGYGKLKVAGGSFYTAVSVDVYVSTGQVFVHLPRITLVGAQSSAIVTAELTGTGTGSIQSSFRVNFTSPAGTCTVYWEYHYN